MANRTLPRMPQETHHKEGNYKGKKGTSYSQNFYQMFFLWLKYMHFYISKKISENTLHMMFSGFTLYKQQ